MGDKNRIITLNKIDQLFVNNCIGCKSNKSRSSKTCESCPIGEEMKQLGLNLTTPRRKEKIQLIISKGQEMTKSDISFLLENEYTKKQIQKFLGMSQEPFNNLMDLWGFSRKGELLKKHG